MGYDIHITRTDHWLEAESNPLQKEAVDRAIESDPELQWSTKDYMDMRGPDGTVERYYAILWKNEPVNMFYKGEITCKNPDESQVIKAVQLALVLGAKVVSDDGEQYELETNSSGKKELVTINP